MLGALIADALFPARAGVILSWLRSWRQRYPFPRAYGGDPLTLYPHKEEEFFSPRMRG